MLQSCVRFCLRGIDFVSLYSQWHNYETGIHIFVFLVMFLLLMAYADISPETRLTTPIPTTTSSLSPTSSIIQGSLDDR